MLTNAAPPAANAHQAEELGGVAYQVGDLPGLGEEEGLAQPPPGAVDAAAAHGTLRVGCVGGWAGA